MSQTFLKLSVVDNALWLVGFLLQVGLALVLLVRRKLKGFPVFVGYIVFAAATTPLLFLTSQFGTRRMYFWFFWVVAFVADPVQLILVTEIARHALHPIKLWEKNMRRSLLAWGLVVTFAATSFAFAIGPPNLKGFDLWEQRESVFSSFFICSALLLLSAFSLGQGRVVRLHVAALALGLFVWSYCVLLQDLFHSVVGWNRDIHVVTYLREVAYLMVLVYWTIRFWNDEKLKPPLPEKIFDYMEILHEDVQHDLRKLDPK